MSKLYGRLSADGGPCGNASIGRSNLDKTKRAHREIRADVQTWDRQYSLELTANGQCWCTVTNLLTRQQYRFQVQEPIHWDHTQFARMVYDSVE